MGDLNHPKGVYERLDRIQLVDCREQDEWDAGRIDGAILLPLNSILSGAGADLDSSKPVVVVCRSGNRSVLAADAMLQMGFADVVSLKTGVRGWNDFEQPLVDAGEVAVDADDAERRLAPNARPWQRRPR